MSTLITRLPVLFLSFCILIAPAAAATPEINQQGADKLQALFENIIQNRKNKALPQNMQYDFDGDVTVELADTYYAVTLPYITIKNFGEYNLKIGMIAINVTPHETPGRWNMAIALPPQFHVTSADDTVMASINIGAQAMTGIWDETLHYMGAIKAAYNNITVTNRNNLTTMRLDEIVIRTDGLERSTPLLFSGIVNIELKNLETINLEGQIVKLDSTTMNARIEGLQGFWSQQTPAANTTTAAPPSLPSFLTSPPKELEASYNIAGFSIFDEQEKKEVFAVDNLNLILTGKELQSDAAALDLDLNYNGMKSDDILNKLAIKDLNLAVVVTKIPMLQLIAMQENSAQSEGNGLSLMFKVPSVLAQTGTIIKVENSKTVGPDYNGAINAEIIGDITAVNAMTVRGGVRIKGLDQFIERMRSYSELIAGMLDTIKPLANNTDPQDGSSPVSRFTFIMDKTGKILVNDQDITKPKAPPPTPTPSTNTESAR